jgi:hypothetical protein
VAEVNAVKYDVSGLPAMTFVDTQGYVSIEAEHFANNVSYGNGKWEVIDDYGRTLSSMKVFPTDLQAKKPGIDAPYLEYRFVTGTKGRVDAYVYCAPTNSLTAETGMKYAVSVDGGKPQVVDTFTKDTPVGRGKEWEDGVMQNIRITKTCHELSDAEVHTLRIYMVDAGFVLQKLVIDCGNNLLESFLGPEESYYTGTKGRTTVLK